MYPNVCDTTTNIDINTKFKMFTYLNISMLFPGRYYLTLLNVRFIAVYTIFIILQDNVSNLHSVCAANF